MEKEKMIVDRINTLNENKSQQYEFYKAFVEPFMEMKEVDGLQIPWLNWDKAKEAGKEAEIQRMQRDSFETDINIGILSEKAEELGLIEETAKARGTTVDEMVEKFEKFGDSLYGERNCDPFILDMVNIEAIEYGKDNDRVATATILGEQIVNEKGEPLNIYGMSVREQVELYRSELSKQLGTGKTK